MLAGRSSVTRTEPRGRQTTFGVQERGRGDGRRTDLELTLGSLLNLGSMRLFDVLFKHKRGDSRRKRRQPRGGTQGLAHMLSPSARLTHPLDSPRSVLMGGARAGPSSC